MSIPSFMPRVCKRPGRFAFAIFFGALLALQCLLPSAAFARSSGRSVALASNPADFIRDSAGVSVVRLVATYSNSLENALSCTALGILVGSGPVANTSPTVYRNWVLTDASLVNSSLAACGTPDGISTLSSVQIWASDEYTASAKEPVLLGALGNCETERGTTTCKNASGGSNSERVTVSSTASVMYALLSFQTASWQPYLTLNADQVAAPALNVGLTDTSGKPATPSIADVGAVRTHLLPTIVPANAGQSGTSSTPQATITPRESLPTPTATSTNGIEGGTPVVDASGKLVGIFSNDGVKLEIGTLPGAALAEISSLIATQAEAPNPLKTGWDGGISAYYAGKYAQAHNAFKAILKTTAQFAAPQTFDALAVNKMNANGDMGGRGSGNEGSGNSQFLLILLGIGLFVLILLLVLVTILVGRARKRRRELERFAAEQQEAQRQAEEEVRRQRMQTSANGEVPCPNCRKPVRLGDTICVHCHYPLSPTASGMGLRLAGTSPLPPPAAAAPMSAMPTRSPLPISEQPTIQFPPAASAASSAEKTLKRKKTAKIAAAGTNDQSQPRNLKLAVATRSDPGLKRKHKPNEDSLFAMQGARKQQPFGLFVVADGMGGHANGQDASRLAIQTMINYMLPKMSNDSMEEEAFQGMLGDGVQQANLAVHQRNLEAHGDMGTTMTTALVVGTTAYVANVGDSRTYLYREGQGLRKVTQDHSVVASLVEAGIIKPDDIYTHPKRNQIYRSLGEKPEVEVDTFKVELQPGDKLLLCSDGLWDMVRDPLIQQVMSKPSEDPNKTGQELIKAALQGGGEDNVSVIVIQLSETDQQISVSNFQLLAKPETVTVPPLPQVQ